MKCLAQGRVESCARAGNRAGFCWSRQSCGCPPSAASLASGELSPPSPSNSAASQSSRRLFLFFFNINFSCNLAVMTWCYSLSSGVGNVIEQLARGLRGQSESAFCATGPKCSPAIFPLRMHPSFDSGAASASAANQHTKSRPP